MKKIRVEASKTYDIVIGRGLFDRLGDLIRDVVGNARLCVVTDSNVDRIYSDRLSDALAGFQWDKFVIKAGEESKCIGVWSDLQNYMCEAGHNRSSVIVAFGGGVVGDLAGFAAACFMRGIRFIQVPTTLLAAVDSSVGGKTAVDLEKGKNLCGAFWQPQAVFCDPDLTKTLSAEVFADGMGEVIKYAVLDSRLTEKMLGGDIEENLENIIAACVEIKRDIVNEDERDTGVRALLNFGHTAAHAIEKLSDFSVSHGSAVAKGMIIVSRGAASMGLCSADIAERLLSLMHNSNIDATCPYSAAELAEAAMSDKKREGGKITLILPRSMGNCVMYPIDTDKLEEFFDKGLESGGVDPQ